jgi:hypothetical protein
MVRQPVARGRPAAPTAEQERVVSEELREPAAPAGRPRAGVAVEWVPQRLAVRGEERVVSEELREPVAQATAPVGRRRAAPTVGWMLQRLAVPGEFWEPAASAD